jgi:hypothetical protein
VEVTHAKTTKSRFGYKGVNYKELVDIVGKKTI